METAAATISNQKLVRRRGCVSHAQRWQRSSSAAATAWSEKGCARSSSDVIIVDKLMDLARRCYFCAKAEREREGEGVERGREGGSNGQRVE